MGFVKRSTLSPKELEARRANARESTGPRTLEGKARVSLNRLQHGGRSAGLEAFLRQIGANPQAFFALCKSNRLPGERVDPLQAFMVKKWLKSPVPRGSLRRAEGCAAVAEGDPRGHAHAGWATVGSLMSAKKMASVMKALSPDFGQVLMTMLFEFALPTTRGVGGNVRRRGTQRLDSVGQGVTRRG